MYEQIINKWFRLLVDGIHRYDDTIRIEDIYKLVEDMDSMDIVNAYYMKGNTEYWVADWADSKSETSIENILKNRGLEYSFKSEPEYNAYLVTLNKNIVRIKEYYDIIILEILKDNNIVETITMNDYNRVSLYLDTLIKEKKK